MNRGALTVTESIAVQSNGIRIPHCPRCKQPVMIEHGLQTGDTGACPWDDCDAHLSHEVSVKTVAFDNKAEAKEHAQSLNDHEQYSIDKGGSRGNDEHKQVKQIIGEIADRYEHGAPLGVVFNRLEDEGYTDAEADTVLRTLKNKGEVYEPRTDHLRVT